MKKIKIIVMGTPEFSVAPFEALRAQGHDIIAAYTQPPRPAGRGKKTQKSAVQIWAEGHDIPVYHPQSLKKDPARSEFIGRAVAADVAIVAAYGLILPQDVLDGPRLGCINIHASILPRWRGAAPIQYAIWKGDPKSGVTIMQMEAGLDTGPMLYKGECDITNATTAQSLHDALSQIGADLIVKCASDIARGELPAGAVQDDTHSNYASMLKKEDGRIDWAQTAEETDCQIRALNPWPGTFIEKANGERFKITEGEVIKDTHDAAIGTLLNKEGDVACGGGGIYRIFKIQPAGKKTMDITSAINGGYIGVGAILGAPAA